MSNKTTDATKGLTAAGVQLQDTDVTPDIQLVSEGDLASLAGEEAFMNEPVTIRIAQSINPNDPPYVPLTCNSPAERVIAPRGTPVLVKRKHVEILARMKEIRYKQQAPVAGDLETGNSLYRSVGQVYPFEIIEDKNAKGRAWLENILAEPAY